MVGRCVCSDAMRLRQPPRSKAAEGVAHLPTATIKKRNYIVTTTNWLICQREYLITCRCTPLCVVCVCVLFMRPFDWLCCKCLSCDLLFTGNLFDPRAGCCCPCTCRDYVRIMAIKNYEMQIAFEMPRIVLIDATFFFFAVEHWSLLLVFEVIDDHTHRSSILFYVRKPQQFHKLWRLRCHQWKVTAKDKKSSPLPETLHTTSELEVGYTYTVHI